MLTPKERRNTWPQLRPERLDSDPYIAGSAMSLAILVLAAMWLLGWFA